MRGLFVVFEGIDAAGKTTTINNILKILDFETRRKIYHHKGFKPNNFPGHIINVFPNTFSFLCGLLYLSTFVISSAYKNNRIILKDRYIESLESYVPENEGLLNRIFIFSFKPLLIKPDILVYLEASDSILIKRLSKSIENPYHKKLIENQPIISLRKRKYNLLFNKFKGKKIKIDTTKVSKDKCAEKLTKMILDNSIYKD